MMLKRQLFVLILLCGFALDASGQSNRRSWEWQDPLDTTWGDLAEKWNIFYNSVGVAVSHFIAYDTLKMNMLGEDYYVTAYLDYQKEYKDRFPRSDIYAGKVRVEQFLRPWVSFGIEASLMFTTDTLQQTIGVGSGVVFNWHVLKVKKHKLNFENGFGTALFTKAFPDRGSKFNFNYFYAFLYHFQYNEKMFLDIGFRNQHISNANLFKDENPGFDSYGLRLGFTRKIEKEKLREYVGKKF